MKINEILNEDYWLPKNMADAEEDFMYNAEELERGDRSYIGSLFFGASDWREQITKKMVGDYLRAVKDGASMLDRYSSEEEAVDLRYEATYNTLISSGLATPLKRRKR
jgi:hypothetical protein